MTLFRNILLTVFTAFPLLIATPIAQAAWMPPQDDPEPAPAPQTCDLDGSEFRSVNQYETGLGPDGPVLGFWFVRFESGVVQSRQSDYSLRDAYTCDPAEGEVSSAILRRGAWHRASDGLLLWEGRWYQQVFNY